MTYMFTHSEAMQFFLWGFIKDLVDVLLLPADLPDLRNRVETDVATILFQIKV